MERKKDFGNLGRFGVLNVGLEVRVWVIGDQIWLWDFGRDEIWDRLGFFGFGCWRWNPGDWVRLVSVIRQ